jgi:hypothetical protein
LACPKLCSYCGERVATDKEHVFPRNLYPPSKAGSRVQRLTIPSCNTCNNGWSDDEAHFRNMLALAGEPNEARTELWNTAIRPSLYEKPDGTRRIRNLVSTFQPVEVDGQLRYKVYPGEDPRVVRVLKKIVRGLSHHHGIETAVPEARVWADVMKFPLLDEFLSEMIYQHREPDIAEYRYAIVRDKGIASAWLITFFERVPFIGVVSLPEGGFLEGVPDRPVQTHP